MRKAPVPPRRFINPFFYLGGYLARVLCSLLGGYHLRGRENIPVKGGAVICGNHISYLDPPLLGNAVSPRRTYFMAKKELFEIPVLGWLIHTVYAFPVERGTTDREAIRHAIDLLNKGELLVVFPEGQRSPDGSLQPGNIGPALMAAKAGVPILPVALKGADEVLPLHAKSVHRGRGVYVDIGQPIYPNQFGEGRLDKSQLQEFTEAVMQAIYELQIKQYERVGQVAPPRVKELVNAE